MNNKAVLIGLSVLAFLVALLLVVVIVRMLLGGRLRMPGGRSRQARLGVVDAFDLDRQRQLIIVRRDNTEHLIMIGGPNDLLIESEIVRIEARDRGRDKADGGFSDRIPAPFAPASVTPSSVTAAPSASVQVGVSVAGSGESPATRPDEPLLPMPLPEAPAAVTAGLDDGAPVRAPTFPLPPRRPSPPLAPERRPPTPPRLPDVVSRDPVPPAPPPAPSAPASDDVPPVRVGDVQATPAAAPQRPPFLKPLPPRPPIRPLKRVTPQPPASEAASPPLAPATAAVEAPPPPSNAPPPAPKLPAPKAPAPTPSALEDVDALDSLEEEMAKLLGRGPGA